MSSEELAQANGVDGIEDVAALDLELEPCPALEAELASERQLCGAQDQSIRDRAYPSERCRFATLRAAEKILRLSAELLEVGGRNKYGHDGSSSAGRPAMPDKEIVSIPRNVRSRGGLSPVRGPGCALARACQSSRRRASRG